MGHTSILKSNTCIKIFSTVWEAVGVFLFVFFPRLFLKLFYFLMAYSWFTMLYWFQVYSKVIQIYTYPGGGIVNPFQHSCLGNPMDRGTLWAIIHGMAESDMTKATEHMHIYIHTYVYIYTYFPLQSITKYWGYIPVLYNCWLPRLYTVITETLKYTKKWKGSHRK